jgi:hypothetical protein
MNNFKKHTPNIFTENEFKSINKKNDYNPVLETIKLMKEYFDTIGVPAHHDD